MAKAMLVTASLMRADPRADTLVMKNLVNAAYLYDPPLLQRMLEMDTWREGPEMICSMVRVKNSGFSR